MATEKQLEYAESLLNKLGSELYEGSFEPQVERGFTHENGVKSLSVNEASELIDELKDLIFVYKD